MDAVKNFAKVTVDGGVEALDTEITLQAGHGARLPAVPFNMVLWNATDYPDPSDDPIVEIVRVTDNTSDVLTVDRGQEGTSTEEHTLAGKTYKMVAGMTARTIIEMVGNADTAVNPYIAVDVDNDNIDIVSDQVSLGDVQGAGNNTTVIVDDGDNRIALAGKIGTDQTASASVAPGTLAAKLPIYDAAGTLVGYIPIYNSIT